MIKTLNEVKSEFIKFLDKNIETDNFYDGFDYYYIKKLISKKSEEQNFVIFTDGNGKIINFASHIKEGEFDVFYLDNADDYIIKNNLNDLKTNYPKAIVANVNSFCECLDTLGAFKLNMTSKVISEEYDCVDSLYCLNKDNIDMLVDVLDEINFPVYTGKLAFEVVDYNDFVYNNMKSDTILSTATINSTNHSHLAGFNYCGLQNDKDDKLLLAKDGENVVGVIKYGIYGGSFEPKHIALCFVDVKAPYRNKGIATALLEEFGNVLINENSKNNKPLPLYLTDESDMGATYHMKDIAINKIKGTICYYLDHNEYQYVSMLNGKELGRGTSYKDIFENFVLENQKNVKNVER